jgi:hypothetical protein
MKVLHRNTIQNAVKKARTTAALIQGTKMSTLITNRRKVKWYQKLA